MSLWNRQNSRLFGAFFTCVGLPSLGIGLVMGHIQSTIIKTWPSVDAEVIKTQVNATRGATRNGFPVTRYETEIVFRYTVGGKEYTSRSAPGYSTSRYSIMKRIADTYAPGTRHLIRHNPEYPNIIFFNAGYNFGFFFLPIMFGGGGLLFTVVGVITLPRLRGWGARARLAGKRFSQGISSVPTVADPSLPSREGGRPASPDCRRHAQNDKFGGGAVSMSELKLRPPKTKMVAT